MSWLSWWLSGMVIGSFYMRGLRPWCERQATRFGIRLADWLGRRSEVGMTGVELTRRVPCATCGGGCGDWSENGELPLNYGNDCKTCDGHGTVRVAVSCASRCRYYNPEKSWCGNLSINVDPAWGCLDWTPPEVS